MSTQTQQQQQQQQPVVVYPNSASLQAPPSHHYRLNGSFATVFIVVGGIIVASAISCFLGRFLNRCMSQTKPSSKRKQNRNLRPKLEGGDIEFGFDGRVPSGKPGGEPNIGETSKGFELKMPGNGDPREFRVSEHGEVPAEFRNPGNGYPWELRVSEHAELPGEFSMPGNGYPGELRASEHGELPGEFRMPGNGYPRIPENGEYVRFRMPENGDPMGFRMTGHGGDINGETKHVDYKAGA